MTTAAACPVMRVHPVPSTSTSRPNAGRPPPNGGRCPPKPWTPCWDCAGPPHPHRGAHDRVDTARLHTLPDQAAPVFVPTSGPACAHPAGRLGDGLLTMSADPVVLGEFREHGGAAEPVQAGLKAAPLPDRARAVGHARSRSPDGLLPGRAGQPLPLPRHVAWFAGLVTAAPVEARLPCGPDEYLTALSESVEPGADEVHLGAIGPDPTGSSSATPPRSGPHSPRGAAGGPPPAAGPAVPSGQAFPVPAQAAARSPVSPGSPRYDHGP